MEEAVALIHRADQSLNEQFHTEYVKLYWNILHTLHNMLMALLILQTSLHTVCSDFHLINHFLSAPVKLLVIIIIIIIAFNRCFLFYFDSINTDV